MGQAASKARQMAEQEQAMKEARQKALTSDMSPTQHAEKIVEIFKKLGEKHSFKVGDIITPKEGCNDFMFPVVGYPVIVHKILEKPVVATDTNVTSSSYGREYDMIVLGLHNGTVLPFHIQSDRFEPYVEAKSE